MVYGNYRGGVTLEWGDVSLPCHGFSDNATKHTLKTALPARCLCYLALPCRLAHNLLVLPLMFTDDEGNLLFMDLFKTTRFHDFLQNIFRSSGLLRYRIVEPSQQLTMWSKLSQPTERCH